ncbi:MAG: type I DNA topoisomerase [Clostridia bacterium]|nr:type I DNA topoisomerase [Clostridia bacterium]
MSKLVIVESPSKAKTIKKYLGRGYDVVASNGHIRDLPKSKLGVDIENNFEPIYQEINSKDDLIKMLRKKAKEASEVYLATDPDREGEAISWHLAHILGLNEDLQTRVTFNEITKTGVSQGMAHPRRIDMDLVDAQQARRILDRIVGYKLSPFLWRKVKTGLSAGRVQSVAVRMVVDRENEIKAFVPVESWTIDASLTVHGKKTAFDAQLYGLEKGKIKLKTKADADRILEELKSERFTVTKIQLGERKASPAPPFITSTLQQDASRRLNFASAKTMRVAQMLYEGVEVGEMGAVGLITYMRTDSLRISEEARRAGNEYILQHYGKQYLPASPRYYKTKSNAQDAHEAIRPTMPEMSPDRVRPYLTNEQYKLYRLIWERFTASLMANAVYDTVKAEIMAGKYKFKTSGSTVKFDGYTVLYEAPTDEKNVKSKRLPKLNEGDDLDVQSIKGNQHFTQPPPRYTEASLIKAFEETGIGRPSTYSATISTIVNRDYIEREGKQLKPTVLGEVVTELMKDCFDDIVNVEFTARMEEQLDEIEEGKMYWKDTLAGFYGDFDKSMTEAEEKMQGKHVRIPVEETDEVCELCGKPMVIRMGRFGKFMACSGYPECKNTKKIVRDTGGICPKCGGRVLSKRSKKGATYFGCENNPNCDFMTWDVPTPEKCPNCGSSLFKKKGRGSKIYCINENCGYERRK